MNESEDSANYGECRCCFTLGNHRDVMKEYEWNGVREIYFKIFLECFNVFLTTNVTKSTLICTSCILRLRDASSFKKMVLEAERSMISCEIKQDDSISDAVPPDDNSDLKPLQTNVEIKSELPDVSFDYSENDLHDCISDSDTYLDNEAAKSKRYKDSIRETFCTVKNNNRTEKLGYIYNTTMILENSNVTPFRPKHQTGFPCFYCRIKFDDLRKMKVHQIEQHTKTELKRVLCSYGAENFVVYVDVTDLKCTMCNEYILNLNELKTHFTKQHKKKLQDVPDRIVPFKVTSSVFECQVCKCIFETFGSIERHMNIHFRNYVCQECGTGYVTKCRLKVHSKQHVGGSYPCETCHKIYSTPIKLKNHIDVVHKMIKRFKCAKCDERFTEYFRRQKHMVETHGVAPLEYKCNVCDKSFDRKYMLSMHMKRDHLEERDYQCEMCSYTCFTKNELKVHMIKHNGERIYECSVCKKSYARKKTLREHMRIHNNDRRYACKACGQAFVQNCSLKGHIKTHHPELLVQ